MPVESKTRIAAIIIEDGKVLMLKGKGHKELWTPGGKLEDGETDEDCLKRELHEEIGVQVTHLEFFKDYPGMSFYHPDREYNQRVYLVSINGALKPAKEIEDFVWLTKDDFEKGRFPMITVEEDKIIPDLINQDLF